MTSKYFTRDKLINSTAYIILIVVIVIAIAAMLYIELTPTIIRIMITKHRVEEVGSVRR